MPDGTRLKKAKLRGQESDGMILAEDELGIGTDHDGIMVLDDALAAGHAAGRRAADRHRRARARDHARTGPTACASTASRARSTPPPARRWRRRRGPTIPARPATVAGVAVDVEDPDLCPRFTARAVRGRDDRPVAAVAEGAPDGRRPAPDQQRRRHHQLRDAAHRPAAARVRPRPRRGRARSSCGAPREGEKIDTLDDVERTLDPSMLSSTTPTGPTSIAGRHGRRALRGRATTPRAC